MLKFFQSASRVIKSSFYCIILIILVTFMINNRGIVTVNLFPLPFELETKTFLLIISSFLLGLIFGILSCSQNIIKHFFISIRDRSKIKGLEKKITKIDDKNTKE